MKTRTLSVIKVLLVAAGILLFCIPALLNLDANTYKMYIPLSVITTSLGVIIPQLLLCINTKKKQALAAKCLFFIYFRFSPYIYVSSCPSHRHRCRLRKRPHHSTCCRWSV